MKKCIKKMLYSVVIVSSITFANDCINTKDIKVTISNKQGIDTAIVYNGVVTNQLLKEEIVMRGKTLYQLADINFDGKNEFLLQTDIGANLSYSVYIIACDKLIPYKPIPYIGNYKIDNAKKQLIIYRKEYNKGVINTYCNDVQKQYLCKIENFFNETLKIEKSLNTNGEIIFQGIKTNEDKEVDYFVTLIKKTYLSKFPSESSQSKMYLIASDKVKLLDTKTDESGQEWYYISYQGKKEIKAWIKAEAVK
ncbi:hypothetical protein [Sulfuricurvum sp.]|uniref:hypothetical protein n=1 Tax=Sulfuricurvum sp. TaxID=2025608 RepID=UPI00260F68C1|nr:hypothetical protein [Sulfuricurvum sp.]MDD2782272.1 hypothetical protein [Sulfuricurvum sp.]